MSDRPIVPPPEHLGRFWAKVDRRGPNECWPWTGHLNTYGYGDFTWGGNPRRQRLATRIIYSLMSPTADINGKQVCHSCDNPCCVNPAHLWLGTNAENMADKVAKGRQLAGERHHQAKLTKEQALFIFYSAAPTRQLAEQFGVSMGAIQAIRRGKQWSTVTRAGAC